MNQYEENVSTLVQSSRWSHQNHWIINIKCRLYCTLCNSDQDIIKWRLLYCTPEQHHHHDVKIETVISYCHLGPPKRKSTWTF